MSLRLLPLPQLRSAFSRVPLGATHLVIGASDSHFSTNSDWDNDFVVHIDVVAPAPEMPGTGEHFILMGREFGQQFTTVDRRQVSPTATQIDVMASCPTGAPDSGTPVLVFRQLIPVASLPTQALPGFWLGDGVQLAGFAYNGQATWSPSFSIGLDPILHLTAAGVIARLPGGSPRSRVVEERPLPDHVRSAVRLLGVCATGD